VSLGVGVVLAEVSSEERLPLLNDVSIQELSLWATRDAVCGINRSLAIYLVFLSMMKNSVIAIYPILTPNDQIFNA